jgi:very-short-patch-repair endonuclease
VEVDGGTRAEQGQDAVRDAWMLTQGIRVFRVWNNDVMGNPDGVLTAIAAAAGPTTASA